MSPRAAARTGWLLFGLSALLWLSALVLNLGRTQYPDLDTTTGDLGLGLATMVFGWFGALVVARQPSQPIGWILCVCGLTGALASFAPEYAIYGLRSHPGVPGAALAAWLTYMSFLVVVPLTALLLLFPGGRPPSRRWRVVLWASGIGAAASVVGALSLLPHGGMALLSSSDAPEPMGIAGVIFTVGFALVLLSLLPAIASLVVRFRRSSGVEREQLKWLVYTVVVVVVVLFLLLSGLLPIDLSELALDLVAALLLALVPVSMGIAILQHRLYEIDRLINRTLVYGLLTAVLAAVYASIVLVLGQLLGGLEAEPPGWVVAGATLAVAAMFRPARRRIQQVVDRRFNRSTYNAARIIDAFSDQLQLEVDMDALSVELLAVVEQTMQPAKLSIWVPSEPARWEGSEGTAG
jgi:hypothetical protein